MWLYHIVNIENGDKYIGQTTRPFIKRKNEHLWELRGQRHGNRFLQAAWVKYGEKAFNFEIIQEFNNLEELNKAEIELIEKSNNLYNFSKGGNGHIHTERTRQQIGDCQKKPIVGMNIKTGEIREYAYVMETLRDGFGANGIGSACKLSTSIKNGKKSVKLSSSGWVWMYKKDFNLEELERRRIKASTGKVRKERPVMGKSLKNKQIVCFRSAAEAGRNGFKLTSVYQACMFLKNKSSKDFVWVFGDLPNSQSLLEERYINYIHTPPKTGPTIMTKRKNFKDNQ